MTNRLGPIPSADQIRRYLDRLLRDVARAKILLTVATELERISQRPLADIERDLAADIANAQRETP